MSHRPKRIKALRSIVIYSLVLQQRLMSRQDHAQIYEMLSVLFLTCSKGEQVQQCIREVITSHPLFSPLPLFLYLSKNNNYITREDLLTFLEENKEKTTEHEIKQIMETVGEHKTWQYSHFLEFIYPFNSAVLREVTNLHLKRYHQLEKHTVPEAVIAGFLILLSEQISLIRKLQVQKGDSLLKIPRERLKKVFLSIKKAGDGQPSHCENDDTRITSHQLRNFMRAFVSVEDSHFLFLSRRLKIKKGSFPIEELEKFIKPSRSALKKSPLKKNQGQILKALVVEGPSQFNREFNEKEYRLELQSELAKTLNLKQSRRKRPTGLQNVNVNTPVMNLTTKRQANEPAKGRKLQDQSAYRQIAKENPHPQKIKPAIKKPITPQDLLIKFIHVFLPTARDMEELKLRLAQHKVDYLKLFKMIDRNQRGVASAEDFYHYYINAGGKLNYSPEDFQTVIARFAQSDEPWLSFSEFCEMVRAQDKQASRGPPLLGEQDEHIVLQILQLCIESELTILKIRGEFKKHESKYLFNQINREQNGFINYQQLKRFLIEAGLQLSMHDLMTVLKRLDRSRNGVVVEHEFISYFQPPQTY